MSTTFSPRGFLASFLLCAVLLGAFPKVSSASSGTIEELVAKIASLQAQLKELKEQQEIPEEETFSYTWNTRLRIGMRNNDDVRALQNALLLEGLYRGKVDGNFGPLTFRAVIAFQSKYGLPADGVVGTGTRVKLNELYGLRVSQPLPTISQSIPTPTQTGFPTFTPPVIPTPTAIPTETPVSGILRILSPNGGEVLMHGQQYPITWIMDGVPISFPAKVSLYAVSSNEEIMRFIGDASLSDMRYAWTVPTYITGKYKIRAVCAASNPTGFNTCSDNSDTLFTVSAAVASLTKTQIMDQLTALIRQAKQLAMQKSDNVFPVITQIDSLVSALGSLETQPANVALQIKLTLLQIPTSGADNPAILTHLSTIETLLAQLRSLIISPLSVDLKINTSDTPSLVAYDSKITVSWISTGARALGSCAANGHYVPLVEGGLWSDLSNLPASGSKTLYARHNNSGHVSPLQFGIQCFDDLSRPVADTVTIPVAVPASTTASLTVLSPNGGEQVKVDQAYTITWRYNRGGMTNFSDEVGIILRSPGGARDRDIVFRTPNTGSYTWTVPATIVPANDYTLEINAFCSVPPCQRVTGVNQDVSDAQFSIVAAGAPSITISGSSGNQINSSALTVNIGNTFTISGVPQNLQGLSYYFGSGYPPSGYYNRAFFFDQTFSNNNLCGTNEASVSGPWIITCTTKVAGSSNFYTEIYANGQIYRSNTVTVTIPSTTQLPIAVLSPNGGWETWAVGSTNPITWSYTGSDAAQVKIDLVDMRYSFNTSPNPITTIANGVSINNASSVSGQGLYNWTIPTSIPLGGNYGVAIYVIGVQNAVDASNNLFSIVSAQPILSAMRDASTPAQNTVLNGSNNNVFARIKLSSDAGGDIKVTSLTITRSGISADSDIKNISLFDGATQIGVTIPTLVGTKAKFENLSFMISQSSSKVISIYADVDLTASFGKTIILGMSSASDISATRSPSGAVSINAGTFPVNGNAMSVASVRLSIALDSSSPRAYFPASGYTLAKFTITAGSSSVPLNSLSTTFSGSGITNLNNIRILVNGVQAGATLNPFSIPNNATFWLGLVTVQAFSSSTLEIRADIPTGTSSSAMSIKILDLRGGSDASIQAVGPTITTNLASMAFNTNVLQETRLANIANSLSYIIEQFKLLKK